MIIEKNEEILVSYVHYYESVSDHKRHNIFKTERVVINEIFVDNEQRNNPCYCFNEAQLVEVLKNTLQRNHGGDNVTIINFWLFQNN